MAGWEWKDFVGIIIAVMALIVSAVTTAVTFWTAERQRLTASAALFTSVADKYNSRDMRLRRQYFAEKLKSPKLQQQIDLYYEDSVLDFFEEIGHFVKRDVLDKEMVWNHFFWYFERYYLAATLTDNLIEKARLRHDFPTLYSETQWLFEQLREVRVKTSGKPYTPPTDEDIKRFLEQESQLIAAVAGHETT